MILLKSECAQSSNAWVYGKAKELEAEVERMRKTIDNGVCSRNEEIIKCDSDTCDDNVEK